MSETDGNKNWIQTLSGSDIRIQESRNFISKIYWSAAKLKEYQSLSGIIYFFFYSFIFCFFFPLEGVSARYELMKSPFACSYTQQCVCIQSHIKLCGHVICGCIEKKKKFIFYDWFVSKFYMLSNLSSVHVRLIM